MKISKWLVIVLLGGAFAIGNIYRFSFFSPQVRVSFLDCVVLVLTVFTFNLKRTTKHNLFKPIVSFAAVGAASLVPAYFAYGTAATLIGGLYLARWTVYSLFFVDLIQMFKVWERNRLAIFLSLVVIITSLAQYIFYPDIRSLQVLEWDPHYFRVVGSWLDPGFTGMLLVLVLVYLTIRPFADKKWQWLIWGAGYLALALTYSRSSYLAFLTAIAWIAIKIKGWKFFAKTLLLLIATIFLLPRAPDGEGVKLERAYSIWSRVDNWKYAITIFKDHPIIGVGFNTYRYAQKGYGFISDINWQESHAAAGSDSSLLFVAAATGLVGIFFYINYLKKLFAFGQNRILQASLSALFVHSLFLNSLFYPAVLAWIAVLVSISKSD